MSPARFWEFAHLTDSLKDMGWVDRIPRAGRLYIGGLHALYAHPDRLREAGITHVVSALDFDLDTSGDALKGYRHLHVREEDDPNADLLRHFRAANAFIDEALRAGGGVFVHCAMGRSRSATLCCAYLMMKDGVAPGAALEQVCEGRPVCCPNPGFREQLAVFSRMLEAGSEQKADEIYHEWLKGRFTGDYWTWEKRSRETKL